MDGCGCAGVECKQQQQDKVSNEQMKRHAQQKQPAAAGSSRAKPRLARVSALLSCSLPPPSFNAAAAPLAPELQRRH